METFSSEARAASSTSTRELSGTELVVARALARRSVASYEGLISEVYGHLSNGGPRNPRNVLAVIMVRLRRKLAAHGIRVRT